MVDEAAASTAQAIPDRAAIRAELEATRTSYHELLNSLSEEDWNKKSANPAWKVRQLMWHLAWALGFFPRGVADLRKEKGLNPPAWLMNPANTIITRIGSRQATPPKVAEKYDAAHAALLECLDGIRDNEWRKGAKRFGRQQTIQSLFQAVDEHFREHEADILKGLGRS